MLQLQRTIGNHAVNRMLQTGAALPGFANDRQWAAAQALQRKPEQRGGKHRDPAQEALDQKRGNDDARAALEVMADVLSHQVSRGIAGAPPRYKTALTVLLQVAIGRSSDDLMRGHARREMFEWSMGQLQPAIAALQTNPDQQAWLDERITQQVADLRKSVLYDEASERVDNSVRIDDAVIDTSADANAREQGKLLGAQLPKLIGMLKDTNGCLLALGKPEAEEAAQSVMRGKRAYGVGHSVLGGLEHAQSLLKLADGYLKLTDKEFVNELKNIKGVFNGVATYSELFKVVLEMAESAVGLGATVGSFMAKSVGKAALAATLSEVAERSGKVLGNVIAGVEIVHGVFTLLDSHATGKQKEEAGRDVAVGFANIAFEGPVGPAMLAVYLEARLAADLYWQGALGLNTGLMSVTFNHMQDRGESMARSVDRLARTSMLKLEEKNPEKAAALGILEKNYESSLAEEVNGFLEECRPIGFASGIAIFPGAYPMLVEVFAPLMGKRRATSGPQVVASATAVLQKITWCLSHADNIVLEATKHRNLKQLHDAEDEGRVTGKKEKAGTEE